MNEALLMWGFGLFALAFLLLTLELFIPSGGILGGMSAISAVSAVVAFFKFSTGWGLTASAALLVLAPVSVSLMIKVWPHTPVGRRLILGSPGTERAEHAKAEAEARHTEKLAHEALIGQEGTALTAMRPVGEIEVDGTRYEGLAQGEMIDTGTQIRVVGLDGTSLKVRAV